MSTQLINPVLRGNLLNIHEKITDLRPSFPHLQMLQQQIQKAFFLIKESKSVESEKMFALFGEIDARGVGSYDEDVFIYVQKEALSILSAVLGNELVRPA